MFRRFWQGWQGSNSRHSVLETDALPTELHPYICVMMIAEGGSICQGHLETGALPIELRPYRCAMMIAKREGFVKAKTFRRLVVLTFGGYLTSSSDIHQNRTKQTAI